MHAGRVVRAQPLAQELLAAPVGAGDVEVADAGRVGEVEHLEGAGAQRGDRAVVAELGAVADVQVAGAPQRREAESESRSRASYAPRGGASRAVDRDGQTSPRWRAAPYWMRCLLPTTSWPTPPSQRRSPRSPSATATTSTR